MLLNENAPTISASVSKKPKLLYTHTSSCINKTYLYANTSGLQPVLYAIWLRFGYRGACRTGRMSDETICKLCARHFYMCIQQHKQHGIRICLVACASFGFFFAMLLLTVLILANGTFYVLHSPLLRCKATTKKMTLMLALAYKVCVFSLCIYKMAGNVTVDLYIYVCCW